MNEPQNKFYTSIARYYSQIFPFNPQQLHFVEKQIAGLSGKEILDIGCATGELAFQLVENQANVTGIDLNKDLLQQAINKQGNASYPRFMLKNMLHLEKDFEARQFDTVLCFGNTLVHLEDKDNIVQMLKGVHKVLKPNGKFLFQILYYDYIVDEQIAELPLIETPEIRFSRRYRFNDNSPIISFYTELYLKKENRTLINETPLLALRSAQLSELLERTGFQKIEFYAGFNQAAFGGKHIPLVGAAHTEPV
ncbi:class I SAM-dependent methyltransferase [Lentimicrobium sp.]